jgi:hypothetical protein
MNDALTRERARSGHDSQVVIEILTVDDGYAMTVNPPHAPTWHHANRGRQ